MWKAVYLAKLGSQMRLTPSAFSRDAHPNEVTTRCGGRWAGLVVSHLVSLGFWGLAPLTDMAAHMALSFYKRIHLEDYNFLLLYRL